jgi:hypothetical protein
MSLSIEHQAPLEICDQHPTLVASLLEKILGEPLPAFDELRMQSADFTQTVAKEFRADRALIFLKTGKPVLAVIVEVQRKRDERKRRSWPAYTAGLFSQVGCPTYLLVIALNAATARWAGQPIANFQPGSRFVPLVVARANIPKVSSLIEAHANLPLALLSAVLHVRDEGGEYVAYYAVRALYEASPEPDRIDRTIWMLGLLGGIVGAEKFKKIERLIMIEPATRIVPKLQVIRDRVAEQVEKRYTKRIEEQYSRGLAEGEAKALMTLLSARGFRLTAAQRQRVMTCTDPSRIETWIERATTAQSATEVLGR